jgi:hypothetical protein
MTTATKPVSAFEDTIDSRDVIARIEFLNSDEELTYGEADELIALQKLQSEAEGSADWLNGETLVRDSYFKEYAQDLAEDIGAISSDASWPNNCIDWDEAARELQMDYGSANFDGVTYWLRY